MKKINQRIKEIETALRDILNRMEINGESNCFVALGDKKDNSASNPRTPLTTSTNNVSVSINKVIFRFKQILLFKKVEKHLNCVRLV